MDRHELRREAAAATDNGYTGRDNHGHLIVSPAVLTTVLDALDAAERTAATGLAAAHRAIAIQARADGDPGRAHLHDWAATQADLYIEEKR